MSGTVLGHVVMAVIMLVSLVVLVAYLTTFERKILAWMQGRRGPNRIGFAGMLQPLADAIKFVRKEYITPRQANRVLFKLAPLWVLCPSWLAWAFIPFSASWVYVDSPTALLWILALSVLSSSGVLFAGWASNSKYARLGALRAASQMMAYEVSLSLSLVSVVVACQSMSLVDIVQVQKGGMIYWLIGPLLPVAVVFWISLLAETHRTPFDVVEGESELVAGYHVEYSGMGFAMFFIAEYSNIWLSSILMSLLFFGGWHSPFEGMGLMTYVTSWVPGICWLMGKTLCWVFAYIWLRASLPRYRFDQIMSIGWQVLVPWSLAWIPILALAVIISESYGISGLYYLTLLNVLIIALVCVSTSKSLKRLLLLDVLKSLYITWCVSISQKSTVEYPEQSTPRSDRFRGALALNKYESGQERCIACRLCEASCPATAITIESHECDGVRQASRFDIDAFKCIHCGLCEDACPVDAIVLTQKEHIVYSKRGQNILTKDILLGMGEAFGQSEPVQTEDDA